MNAPSGNERSIFIAALQREDAADRASFLDEACGGNADLRREVEGLLRDLEGKDREIACRFLQGYTAEEIARELGCSERTARRMRWRLKHRLRRLLDEGGGEP